MAHSFYAYLAQPIVVGELLTFKVSRDTEHKTTAFFQLYFQENTLLYPDKYGNCKLHLAVKIRPKDYFKLFLY